MKKNKQEISFAEWKRRVRGWLWHMTTKDDWDLVDAREHYDQGQAPRDYAKFLVEATS